MAVTAKMVKELRDMTGASDGHWDGRDTDGRAADGLRTRRGYAR